MPIAKSITTSCYNEENPGKHRSSNDAELQNHMIVMFNFHLYFYYNHMDVSGILFYA